MKVLLSCISFGSLTGSELYYYELSRSLAKRGNKVTLISDLGDGILSKKAEEDGVICRQGHKQSALLDPTLLQEDLPDEAEFDACCFSHDIVFRDVLNKRYPSLPKLMVCHSEVLGSEVPVVHDSIKHYVGIRQSICSKMLRKSKELSGGGFYPRGGVNSDQISLIKNPIDVSRFNNSLEREAPERKTVLFVGSIDFLRLKPILHLYEMSKTLEFDLVIVGRNDYPAQINENLLNGAKIYESCWDVEKYLKEADIVAGIFMGRTTIEGWCAGKTSFQYIVDKRGNIVDLIKEDPPEDLLEFDSMVVAEKIEDRLRKI